VKIREGWRYVAEFPGCQFVSRDLYATQGEAFDNIGEAVEIE